MQEASKEINIDDLPGLRFKTRHSKHIFTIEGVINGECYVTWPFCKFPVLYGSKWVLKYLNGGIWILTP